MNKPPVEDLLKIKYCLDGEQKARKTPTINDDELLSKINPDYCIVYIDNPNNPSGQFISLSDIDTIVRKALLDQDFILNLRQQVKAEKEKKR